jgi:outer membrane protein assembly factor BamB
MGLHRSLPPSASVLLKSALFVAASVPAAPAADWPQVGADAARSGRTAQTLPADLKLCWVRQLPARKPAWADSYKLHPDAGYEPVVKGKRLYVGCVHNGALIAYETETGRECWRYYTGGPIRFAPAAGDTLVYAGSDDGFLHAVNAADGKPAWKVSAGPRRRLVIGHEWMISAWPVTAGPVLADGAVAFAAGVWPMDGVFATAADASSGACRWIADLGFWPADYVRCEGGAIHVPGYGGGAAIDLATGAVAAAPKGGGVKKKAEAAPSLPDGPGVEGKVTCKIAADDKLFVTTDAGRIYCFSGAGGPGKTLADARQPAESPDDDTRRADALVKASGVSSGWCLVVGLTRGRVVERIVRATAMKVVAIEPDAARADAARRRLDALGLFDDNRLQVLQDDPAAGGLPPYVFHLIVSEDDKSGLLAGADGVALAFRSLRPYGGAIAVAGEPPAAFARVAADRKPDRAALSTAAGVSLLRREGALPGSCDWTHEFGNAGNTLASTDKLVRPPFGVQWYGGPAAHIDRYYIAANLPVGPVFMEGRMILQGNGNLGCFDQYTGRRLWDAALPKMFYSNWIGSDSHGKLKEPMKEYPKEGCDLALAQRARSGGFNCVPAPDQVYVAAGPACMRFGIDDGKPLGAWKAPVTGGEPELCWGNLRVAGDVLVATAFHPQDTLDVRAGADGNGGEWVKDRIPQRYLFALDRKTGKLLWQKKAAWGFLDQGQAVGGGRVYALDLVMELALQHFKAAGRKLPDVPPTLYAFDLATGRELWKTPLQVLVRQLTYCEERDLLIAPCRNLSTWENGTWKGDPQGKRNKDMGVMTCYRGKDGSVVWKVNEAVYQEPFVILHDWLVTRYGNPFNLGDGKPNLRPSPVTGFPYAWQIRKGGCNHLVLGEHVAPSRFQIYDLFAGAGMYDIRLRDNGCTPGTIPASGLLNIPMYVNNHGAGRESRTALACVHVPENAYWTDASPGLYGSAGADAVPVRRMGINLGAMGSRMADDGTMWFAVSAKPREDPTVAIQGQPIDWFAVHPARVRAAAGRALPWVASSGVLGATEIVIPTLTFGGKALLAGAKGRPAALKNPPATRRYDVVLHFIEPHDAKPGERVFSVAVQGKVAAKDLDVAKSAGGPWRALAVEVPDVGATDALTVTLKPSGGGKPPVICGVEIQEKGGGK